MISFAIGLGLSGNGFKNRQRCVFIPLRQLFDDAVAFGAGYEQHPSLWVKKKIQAMVCACICGDGD